MTPRNTGAIISVLLQTEEDVKNIVENFCNVVTELYTHPKEEINKVLMMIKDGDIFTIREGLFLRCCQDQVISKKFLEGKIHIKEGEPLANLRKRYKADKCYEDIFILAISMIEQKLHKDISKIVISIQPQQVLATTANGEPIFTAAESAIIAELHKIRDGMKEIRRENKELKEKLNLANTKIDKYETLLEVHNTKILELTEYIIKLPRSNESSFDHIEKEVDNNSRSHEKQNLNDNNDSGDGSFIHGAGFGNSSKEFNRRDELRSTDTHQLLDNRRLQQHHEQTRPTMVTGDGDGFQVVSHRRRKPIYGTKTLVSGTSASIAGVRSQREFSLFVGGLKKNLSCEMLSRHIQEDLHITPKSVEINKTNEYNRSFKITVQYKDKDTMFTPTNWEGGVIIKPFRVRSIAPAS